MDEPAEDRHEVGMPTCDVFGSSVDRTGFVVAIVVASFQDLLALHRVAVRSED